MSKNNNNNSNNTEAKMEVKDNEQHADAPFFFYKS